MTTHINSGVAQRTSLALGSVALGQYVGMLTDAGEMITGLYAGMSKKGHGIKSRLHGLVWTRDLHTTYRSVKDAQKAIKRPPPSGQLEMFHKPNDLHQVERGTKR